MAGVGLWLGLGMLLVGLVTAARAVVQSWRRKLAPPSGADTATRLEGIQSTLRWAAASIWLVGGIVTVAIVFVLAELFQ